MEEATIIPFDLIATQNAKEKEGKEISIPFDVEAAMEANREEVQEIAIPFDVVAECILPSVPAIDLMRLSSVCKSWHQLIYDTDFVHTYLRRQHLTLHQTQPPFLATTTRTGTTHHHGRKVIITFSTVTEESGLMPSALYGVAINFDDINGRIKDKNEPTKILSLKDWPFRKWLNVLPPCKGLVLFETLVPVYLCNPVTGEYTTLPQSNNAALRKNAVYCYGFGFDGHSKVFKVLHIWRVASGINQIDEHEILSLGKGSSWRQLGRLPFHKVNRLDPGRPLNNCLHWLVCSCDETWRDNRLMAFDLGKEEFRQMALPPGVDKDVYEAISLTDPIEGCLALGNYKFQDAENVGLDIWVLGDYESEIWTKRHHISFATIGRAFGFLYEENYGHSIDHPFPYHSPRILFLGNDEILVRIINGPPLLLYDSKLKTFRKFVVDGDESMLVPGWPPTYIYEPDHRSAYFISALHNCWSTVVSSQSL